VYFPRILVTGPFNAGKSTVVRTLCKNTVSVDRMGTTVAFDYGNLELMGLEAEVFGTPGQDRFDFVFSIFAREVNGVLLVIDGTRTEDLPRARQMIDLVGKDVSLVILANKSDLAGGMTEDMIRAELGVEPSIPVIRTIATQGVGLTEALHALAEMIMGVR